MRLVLMTLAILFVLPTFAQNRVGINETQLTTAKGDQPAFEFFIPDTEATDVIDAWNKFHKSFKVKPRQDKNQRNYYFSDDAMILELSENTIDIYSRIYETGGGVRFTCAFDLGGVFISSNKTSDKFSQAKLLLNKFYAQMAMNAIVAEIEKELLALEVIKNEYTQINEELEGFKTMVDSYKDDIEEAESEESEILSDLTAKSTELAGQRSQLDIIQAELKSINKQNMVADLTSFNADLKRVNLETTKIEKDIDRKKAEIAALEADIDLLDNSYSEKTQYAGELQIKITAIENRFEELRIDEKEDNLRLLEQNILKIESVTDDLTVRKNTYIKTVSLAEDKLKKAKDAVRISKETQTILEKKIDVQEAKLRELEELKATIE